MNDSTTYQTQLNEIRNLGYNWNDNYAEAFSPVFVDAIAELAKVMPLSPEIFPVANGNIQFEYNRKIKTESSCINIYLEFEMSTLNTAKLYYSVVYDNENKSSRNILSDIITEKTIENIGDYTKEETINFMSSIIIYLIDNPNNYKYRTGICDWSKDKFKIVDTYINAFSMMFDNRGWNKKDIDYRITNGLFKHYSALHAKLTHEILPPNYYTTSYDTWGSSEESTEDAIRILRILKRSNIIYKIISSISILCIALLFICVFLKII